MIMKEVLSVYVRLFVAFNLEVDDAAIDFDRRAWKGQAIDRDTV